MPIFEYACDDCGTKFEKLVRRAADEGDLRCPSCGHDHLTTQYSTFAARSGTSKRAEAPGECGAGMCGSGMCQGGMCGMDMN
jgi:putative FmdB family regulatory protein